MIDIVDRQTFVFSLDLQTATSSQIQTFLNLRFSADELILKSIVYNVPSATDTDEVLQIWCNVTNDGLIGAFPNNAAVFLPLNTRFRLNNSFQTGNFVLQFQTAGNDLVFHYNSGALTSNTHGVVAVTIEFIKLKK